MSPLVGLTIAGRWGELGWGGGGEGGGWGGMNPKPIKKLYLILSFSSKGSQMSILKETLSRI